MARDVMPALFLLLAGSLLAGTPCHTAGLYTVEDVRFNSDDVTLAGSLFIPEAPGPHPALVLLHGSGPMTRQGPGQYLTRIADAFARSGLAVLRYDKRGTGASSGSWTTASFDDLADDALAAVALLKARADINASEIGLWGISQAGWVMTLANQRAPDIAFNIVVSAGGTGVTPAEQNLYNVTATGQSAGLEPAALDAVRGAWQALYAYVRTGSGPERLDGHLRRTHARYPQIPARLLPPLSSQFRLEQRDQWFTALDIDFDPVPYWRRYNRPLLALYGALDHSTPVDTVILRLEQALEQAGNADYTIRVFENGGHILVEGDVESAFLPGYLEAMKTWLLRRVTVRR